MKIYPPVLIVRFRTVAFCLFVCVATVRGVVTGTVRDESAEDKVELTPWQIRSIEERVNSKTEEFLQKMEGLDSPKASALGKELQMFFFKVEILVQKYKKKRQWYASYGDSYNTRLLDEDRKEDILKLQRELDKSVKAILEKKDYKLFRKVKSRLIPKPDFYSNVYLHRFWH